MNALVFKFPNRFISLVVEMWLLAALVLPFGAKVAAQAKPANPPQENPKLGTPLVVLSRSVSQSTAPPAPDSKVAPPSGFSIGSLPKSIQDAQRAGHLRITKNAEVQVYIEADAITDTNLAQLRALGVTVEIIGEPKPDKTKGEVLRAAPTVQGLLPVTMINQVSALPFVRYIRLPDYPVKNTGSVDSQGDTILRALQARNQFGVDGRGVRVGAISDGIGGVFATGCTTCGPTTTETPSPINSGDLPSATGTRNSSGILTSVSGSITAQSFRSDGNLEGCPGACDTTGHVGAEGTAMLEIIHDLAPGAQLYFANSDTGMAFEKAVNWITQNTDVGVDDLSFFSSDTVVFPGVGATAPFDGTSAVSANTAADLNTDTNPVRGYFTAVGNYAYNHWAGPWNDSGQFVNFSNYCSGLSGDLQLFQATANTIDLSNGSNPNFGYRGGSFSANFLNLPVQSGATVYVYLTWDDPWSGSSNDYGLLLSAGPSIICNNSAQTGTQPPIEELAYTNNTTSSQYAQIEIINVNNAAAPRNFDMFVTGIGNGPNLNFYTPSGSVPAESDAGGSPVSVVSVGATNAQVEATGDAPAAFIEPYSSLGPTEATPQAAARMKPDVTATDNVSVTGAGGFGYADVSHGALCPQGNPSPPGCYFAGTSAAAPHVAAIAALVLQTAPCLLSSSNVNTPATARINLRNLITSTAIPLPGASQLIPNNIEGFGLVDALTAIQAASPTAYAVNQTLNGVSQNGASITLNVGVKNSDPDNCPLTFSWSGPFGTATGANPTVIFPFGVNEATLKVSNGGVSVLGTAQITVTDFTLAGPQSGVSVVPGQASIYTISIGERFGPFTNPVSLACSGLPALASCSFSPASVTPGSGTTTVTLTISTTATSLGVSEHREWPGISVFSIWLTLLSALLAGVMLARRSGRELALVFTFGALVLCLGTAFIACSSSNASIPAANSFTSGGGSSGGSGSGGPSGGGGSSSPGTPVGTYTITVTGTSNQLHRSTTVTLDVS